MRADYGRKTFTPIKLGRHYRCSARFAVTGGVLTPVYNTAGSAADNVPVSGPGVSVRSSAAGLKRIKVEPAVQYEGLYATLEFVGEGVPSAAAGLTVHIVDVDAKQGFFTLLFTNSAGAALADPPNGQISVVWDAYRD